MIDKHVLNCLDLINVFTAYFSFLNGVPVVAILGVVGTLLSMVSHGINIYKNIKNKNK
jgi:hypothetical protein